MVLCALTVDLDAYTGAETPFLLLIRFLSLNLYWNPSQAIIHMRMVYLLWAYIKVSFSVSRTIFILKLWLQFQSLFLWENGKNGCSQLTQSIKSCWTSRWLYNLKDWIISPWQDVENPFASRETEAAVGIFVVRKTFCWVKCWQAGRQ